jgi:hypothetical protein
VNTSKQAEPIPSLGTNEETYKALSQLRSGLGLFILTGFFSVTAYLTARVDETLPIPRNLVQAKLLPIWQAFTLLAISASFT